MTHSYRLDLLREIPADVAAWLRRQCITRSHPDGVTLIQRGQPVQTVLVLLRGRLRSVTSLPDGSEHLIRWIEPGEAIGVASVLAQLPFQADLIASGRVEVLVIPGELFVNAIQQDAKVGLVVSRLLATRLSEMFDHVAVQAQGRLPDRLLSTLHHLASENGEKIPGGHIRLRVTQQDISDAVGASRQRVNEALRGLQHAGHLQVGYRQILLAIPSSQKAGRRPGDAKPAARPASQRPPGSRNPWS